MLEVNSGTLLINIVIVVSAILLFILGGVLFVKVNNILGVGTLLIGVLVLTLLLGVSNIVEEGWKDYNAEKIQQSEILEGTVELITIKGNTVNFAVDGLEYNTLVDTSEVLDRFKEGDTVKYVVYQGYLPKYDSNDNIESLQYDYITEVIEVIELNDKRG